MNASNRKSILYIASSLDGYIAGPHDDLSFLETVQLEGEDYGYGAFMKTVDVVIMGRKTYDWVLTQVSEFPHANLESYIITRSAKPTTGKTTFYSGDLSELITGLKAKAGKNIFIDGGANLVDELLKLRLIDEIYLSVIPILLGNGTRLFKQENPAQKLKLISARQFETGLCQLHYELIHQ